MFDGRGHAHRALGNLTESVQDSSRANEFFEIIAHFGEELVTPRTRADCLIARGSTLAALHEYVFALDDFDKAIANLLLLQQNQREQDRFNATLVDCMIRRGNALRGLSAIPESLGEYDYAIELCGRPAESERKNTRLRLLERAYLNRSIALAMDGDFAHAVLDLKSARKCAAQGVLAIFDQLMEVLQSPFRLMDPRPSTGRVVEGIAHSVCYSTRSLPSWIAQLLERKPHGECVNERATD